MYIIIVLALNFVLNTRADSVLGCGGFIKSHVPIDLSKVEVKLFTKNGILKDKTSCAPNNGYYFVPLYDKGEYILQLEPPTGWSFTPTSVTVNVDGVSDVCSQGKDINFSFKGFGITGKVESLGTNTGPKGVEVELRSNAEVRTTVTDEGGAFFFTPVYPGSYKVAISHPTWKIYKKSLDVVVAQGNTDLPAKSFIVQGYDVVGAINSKGEPIKDTTVLLFQKGQNANVLVDGCEKEQIPNLKMKQKPLCHITTDEQGVFTFGTVPTGNYYLVPWFKEQNIHFRPDKIEFSVQHNSLKLQENFEIIGFSIVGRVLKSLNGAPLAGAKIFLDGKQIAKTDDKTGAYKLEKLKVGSYKLLAESDGLIFNEIHTKINPSMKQLPDLIPSAYKVCGNVLSDQSQTVTFIKTGSTFLVTSKTDNKGLFCEYLPPAKYEVQVVVNNDNRQKGLQFFPIKQSIEVINEQVSNIIFSQLKATVTGKIQCIRPGDCEGLKVSFKPSGNDAPDQNIILNIEKNTYSISDVYPGIYEVSLVINKFCWKANMVEVNVNSAAITVPTFIQTGYNVQFISSHNTKVLYKQSGKSELISHAIPKGFSIHCVPSAGEYSFQLESCHTYPSDTIIFNTEGLTNEMILNALKHKTTLAIESETNQGKLQVSVKVSGEKHLIDAAYNKGLYEVNLMLSPTDSAVVVPQSDILYFTPPILSINGGDDCANLGVKFKAVKGKVFKGKVTPALAGVVVTVESENTESLSADTDENGLYKFPPLDDTKVYKITAKKDSYVMVGPNNEGTFFAHKLAEIVVEVVDENKAPLPGALLSLSGGESYRSNLQTNEDGRITFHSLSPSEYFLRPMMKEYKFEPTSKIIQVKEGQTVHVQLKGKRVAYSAFGQVTSLNSAPEDNMVILASGVGNCSHFSEETTSESTGHFRIRGLQPYCSYVVTVKGNGNPIERSAPSQVDITSIDRDFENIKLIVFRQVSTMDILVKVFAENPEHYKNLRVKLFRESAPSAVIHSSKVELSSIKMTKKNNKGIMLQMPSVPIDGKSYNVQLLSSLPQTVKWVPQAVNFNANGTFKYVELSFAVKTHVAEQHIKQTSVWTLFLIFSIIVALYNIEIIAAILRDKFNFNITGLSNYVTAGNAAKKQTEVFNNAQIEEIVQSINNLKRKPKPKKA